MAAEPRQERSRERRDALLRAALELLAEGGARAVTHRAVAARAGVPPASTTYFFDSIQELTHAAFRRQIDDRVAEMERLVDDVLGLGGSVEEVGEQVADALAEQTFPVIVAVMETYLEAARDPALRAPVGEALTAVERFVARALQALGARAAEQAAPAFVALIDGFALHRVARPRPIDTEKEALRQALRALFVAQVMDDDERATWDERLRQPRMPVP